MPCLFVIVLLAFPRVALIVMYLTSTYLQRAYHDLIVPILGFIFLPITTIVYAWLVNSHMPPLEGINLVYLVVAVIIDLGGLGGGESHRRRRL